MSQVHHCMAWTPLQWDTELTKLIPGFQHPKFLPLSHLVASICRWVNAKERKTACTYQIPPTAPCLQTEGESTQVFVCTRVFCESSKKLQHVPFHEAMACHTDKRKLALPNSHPQILYYWRHIFRADRCLRDNTSGTALTSNCSPWKPLKGCC